MRGIIMWPHHAVPTRRVVQCRGIRFSGAAPAAATVQFWDMSLREDCLTGPAECGVVLTCAE